MLISPEDLPELLGKVADLIANGPRAASSASCAWLTPTLRLSFRSA